MPMTGHWRCEWCGEMGGDVFRETFGARSAKVHRRRCRAELLAEVLRAYSAGEQPRRRKKPSARYSPQWNGLL